jgi:hypothetical protein
VERYIPGAEVVPVPATATPAVHVDSDREEIKIRVSVPSPFLAIHTFPAKETKAGPADDAAFLIWAGLAQS